MWVLLLLVTGTLVVHLHVDELVLVIVAAGTAGGLATGLALVLLLHPFVLRSAVLEPDFDLRRRQEETMSLITGSLSHDHHGGVQEEVEEKAVLVVDHPVPI